MITGELISWSQDLNTSDGKKLALLWEFVWGHVFFDLGIFLDGVFV